MSDTQQGPGSWQASDGKWYPAESHPNYSPPPPPPTLPTLPQPGPAVTPPTVPASSYTAPVAPATKPIRKKRRWLRYSLYLVGALVLILVASAAIQGFKDGFSKDEPKGQPTPSCTDATGDGDGTFDLTSAAAESTDDGYIFSAAFTGPAEGRETSVTWSANFGDGDDWRSYYISGGTYTDDPPDAWVFDLQDNYNDYLTDFDVLPNSVRLTVPGDLLEDIKGKAFTWEATLSIDGNDIDSCGTPIDAG